MEDDLEQLSGLTDATAERSADDLFQLLATRERRVTIAHLSEHPDATVDELATVLAGRAAVDEEKISDEADYEDAYIRLFHSILPRFEDYGLLEFDTDQQAVRNAEVPRPVLAVLGIER